MVSHYLKIGSSKIIISAVLLMSAVLFVIWFLLSNQITDPDTLVHLSLDDIDSRDIATDSSGNSNDGVISGATYTTESIDGSTGSLEFDGVDDVVIFEALDADGAGLTLAAWIKADSFPGDARDSRIISKASGKMTRKHVFMLSTVKKGTTDDTVLRAQVRLNGKTTNFRASAGKLETGIWYHTAMTYDESTIRLYVNGSEVANATFPEAEGGPVDIDSRVNVAVGANPTGSHFFDGKIDDVIIAQRVYTADELMTIVNQGTDGSTDTADTDNAAASNAGNSLVTNP